MTIFYCLPGYERLATRSATSLLYGVDDAFFGFCPASLLYLVLTCRLAVDGSSSPGLSKSEISTRVVYLLPVFLV